MKYNRLTKKQVAGFMKAAEMVFEACEYGLDTTQYSCSASALCDIYEVYTSFLEPFSCDYMGIYCERGFKNFSSADRSGFGLDFEQRQLARSLMLLLVMEANK